MTGYPSDYEVPHEITLDGNTVCRDGVAVKITANPRTRDLRIGCTKVSRAALVKLLEMSTNSDMSETLIQQGKA